MAIELIEGWDEFVAADVLLRYSGNPTISGSGRVAGKAVTCGNQTLSMSFTANARYTVGFALRLNNNAASVQIMQLREGTTIHGVLRFEAGTNCLSIGRSGGTAVNSANLGFVAGVWYYIEIDYTVHDTTGAWEVRVNESPVIGPTSSIDTRNAGTLGVIDNIFVTNDGGNTRDFDDMYFASGTSSFQGDCRVITQWATSDGALTDWTASAGNRWAAIDDATQNGDTDYITSATSNHRYTGIFTALGVTGTIKALALSLWGRKDDAAARSMNGLYRRGGVNYDSATVHTLSTTTAGYQTIPWEQDPAAGPGAWTPTNVDAGEYGVKHV